MKIYKIVIFIFAIISSLAIICIIFPSDGITIHNIHFNFPSMEEVLVQNDLSKQENLKLIAIADSIESQQMSDLKDTLEHFKTALMIQPGRFSMPNDDIHYFDRMFGRFGKAKEQKQTIRVLHYGDSQIEMDRLSSSIRTYFQKTFGGGGPGMVPYSQSIPSFAVSQYCSENYTTYSSYGDGNRDAGGNYGIMAKCYRMSGAGSFTANASSSKKADDRVKQFSNIKLLLNDRSGNFQAVLKDKKGSYIDTQYTNGKGIQLLHWQLDNATSSINIKLFGQADIYGIMLDKGYGVAVDNIPLRGSSGTIYTAIKDTVLQKCFQLADVGLIILQFGGNSVPNITNDKSLEQFVASVKKQILFLQRIYPDVPLLYIGPSDMSTRRNGTLQSYPYLPKIVASLKTMLTQNGVAYWDLYEAMGGENSMIAWVHNGLAGSDYIHFTPKGAEKMGEILSHSFSLLYQFYLMRQNIDKQQFDTLWNASYQQ